MRWDNHGWDNAGPAAVAEIRGGLDANGKIVAYDYTSISGGTPPTYSTGDQYMPNLVNRRLTSKTPPAYLRTGPLRGPGHIQPGWASEQIMDELAHAANMDPLKFRQLHCTDPYWRTVLDTVGKLANWQPKVAASNLSNERLVTGRGISLSAESHTNDDVDAGVVADIQVDRKTGHISVKHLYGVQDSGVVVNPGMVNQQLEGMLVTGVSRALLEQVTMSKRRVTSLDWVGYPTLRFKDHPKVTTTYVWRQDELAENTSQSSGYNGPKYRGAGESLIVPTVSAIGNAFFDATAVRMRRYPLTPPRVLAALKSV